MAAEVQPGDIVRLKEIYGDRAPGVAGVFLRVMDVEPTGEAVVRGSRGLYRLAEGSYKVVLKAG